MNPTLSTRIDYETKIAFTHICEEIGITPSEAVRFFAKAVIDSHGIPFEIKHKLPNKLTIQAMEELNSGQGHKADSIDALFKEAEIDLNYA